MREPVFLLNRSLHFRDLPGKSLGELGQLLVPAVCDAVEAGARLGARPRAGGRGGRAFGHAQGDGVAGV